MRRTPEGGGGMGRPNVCRLPGQRRVPANFVTISQSSIMMGRVKQVGAFLNAKVLGSDKSLLR